MAFGRQGGCFDVVAPLDDRDDAAFAVLLGEAGELVKRAVHHPEPVHDHPRPLALQGQPPQPDRATAAVLEAGEALDVIMIPKVEGAPDIHYADRLLAQLEAKAGLGRPILVHAILETAQGVVNVEEIATASPRLTSRSRPWRMGTTAS